ncbi:MAG: DUF2188 domain-containing protein [Bryobacterales bacterium]|nr:DUF2188 domain-containing protein [Bryobacterales bacterium]
MSRRTVRVMPTHAGWVVRQKDGRISATFRKKVIALKHARALARKDQPSHCLRPEPQDSCRSSLWVAQSARSSLYGLVGAAPD